VSNMEKSNRAEWRDDFVCTYIRNTAHCTANCSLRVKETISHTTHKVQFWSLLVFLIVLICVSWEGEKGLVCNVHCRLRFFLRHATQTCALPLPLSRNHFPSDFLYLSALLLQKIITTFNVNTYSWTVFFKSKLNVFKNIVFFRSCFIYKNTKKQCTPTQLDEFIGWLKFGGNS
jgi:hypothetical protein